MIKPSLTRVGLCSVRLLSEVEMPMLIRPANPGLMAGMEREVLLVGDRRQHEADLTQRQEYQPSVRCGDALCGYRDGSKQSENIRPAIGKALSVRVPQKLTIVRTPDAVTVSVDQDSFEPVELMVDSKPATGVMWKLYVHPANAPRLSQPERAGINGGTDFNLGSAILNSRDHDFPILGQPFIIEMDLAIFETPVPPQHMWSVVMGANYRVLRQSVIKQTIE